MYIIKRPVPNPLLHHVRHSLKVSHPPNLIFKQQSVKSSGSDYNSTVVAVRGRLRTRKEDRLRDKVGERIGDLRTENLPTEERHKEVNPKRETLKKTRVKKEKDVPVVSMT